MADSSAPELAAEIGRRLAVDAVGVGEQEGRAGWGWELGARACMRACVRACMQGTHVCTSRIGRGLCPSLPSLPLSGALRRT